MNGIIKGSLIGLAGLLLFVSQVAAHCEIPCGIYDDQMRVTKIREDIITIEKAMIQIIALQKEQPANSNQLVRWIMNKEDHASALQQVVSQYFMTQRIKPDAKEYQAQLSSLHGMLIAAMECKQSTDLAHVKKLRELVDRFETLYFHKHEPG